MRRTVMFITTTLAVGALALPATAAPPPGFPPSSPPGQGGERPAPPRSNPGTPAELSIDDVTVAEGATATLTITASAAPTQDVTVAWTTVAGTATAGQDYAAASGTATIAKGTTATTVMVDTIDDQEDDDAECFTIQLSNASAAATIADGTGMVSITDDDEPSDLPEVYVEDVSVDEERGAFVRVRASSQNHTEPITVAYETVDGTAVAGSDYTAASGTVMINAGATVGTIGIGLVSDLDLEPDETFEVVLTGVTSGNAVLAADPTGTVTIVEGFCNTNVGDPYVPNSTFTHVDKVCAGTMDTRHVHAEPGALIPAGETFRAELRSDLPDGLSLALAVPGGEASVGAPLMEGDVQVGWVAQLRLAEAAPEVLVEVLNDGQTDALYRLDVHTTPPPPA